MLRRTLLAIALVFVLPASAGAAVIQDFSAFTSATNGIALGPDGNYWVAEENSTTVARMTPAGDDRRPRRAWAPAPTSVAAGPDGTVWVSVTGSTTGSRASPWRRSRSSPIAMSAGLRPGRDRRRRQRVHVLLPAHGTCGGHRAADRVDRRRRHRTGPAERRAVTSTTSRSANGKLFAPLTTTATRCAATPSGSARRDARWVVRRRVRTASRPTAPGNVWVSLNRRGRRRTLPGRPERRQRAGVPGHRRHAEPAPSASSPPSPACVGRRARTAATSPASPPTAAYKFFAAGGEPFDIAKGLDGDVYFTDRTSTRVRRLISSAPRITGGAGAATATTSANVSASIDARGNATTVDVRVRTDDRVRRGGHRPGQRRGSVPGRRHAHRARAGHDVPPAGAGDQRGGRGRPERRHDLRDARRARARRRRSRRGRTSAGASPAPAPCSPGSGSPT